jgi:hypothetical protein
MIGIIFVCFVGAVLVYAIYSAPPRSNPNKDRREFWRWYIGALTQKDGTVLSEAEMEDAIDQAIAYEELGRQRLLERCVHKTEMTETDMIYKLSNDVAALRSLLEKKEESK